MCLLPEISQPYAKCQEFGKGPNYEEEKKVMLKSLKDERMTGVTEKEHRG